MDTAARDEIERLKSELERTRGLLDLVFDEHHDAMCLFGTDGTLRMNRAGNRMYGIDAAAASGPADMSGIAFFEADRTTPMSYDQLPAIRALQGVEAPETTLWMIGGVAPSGMLIAASAKPLPGGGALTTFRDLTEKARLEADLAERSTALAQRESENRDLVERLRAALDDLSAPVLEVAEDVLVLPVIGVVDSQRTAQICARLLEQVARSGAKQVIIDVTGVDVIDTTIADRLAGLARAVQMLGAHCTVSGIQPAVASTMIDLGITLAGIDTERNLRRALERSMPKVRSRKVQPAASER